MTPATHQPLRWDNPGQQPYTGGKAEAVMRLGTIPEDTRRTLAVMVDGQIQHFGPRDEVLAKLQTSVRSLAEARRGGA